MFQLCPQHVTFCHHNTALGVNDWTQRRHTVDKSSVRNTYSALKYACLNMGIWVLSMSELNHFVITLLSPDYFLNLLCSSLAVFLHSFLKANPIPVLF